MMDVLKPFDFVDCPRTTDDLFFARLKIEGAMAELKALKAALDEELITVMQEQKITEFQAGPEENRVTVAVYKEKNDTVDTKTLTAWLSGDDPKQRAAALECIAGGQAAWKPAKSKIIGDSMGVALVQTAWLDKIKVNVVETQRKKMLAENKANAKKVLAERFGK